ncbi:MAG: spermidine synthase, partial [Nocardioides sp.]
VPPELLTAPVLAEVARVLAPTGVALLNVVDRAPFPVIRSTVAGLRAVLPHLAAGLEPATRRARRPGNVLLLAGAAPVPVEAWRARSSTGLSPYQVLDGGQVSSSFGGGTPAQDADTACWPG